MADDAAVDLVIDDAAVDAIAREFRVEDRELLLRCLVEAATAYRDNAEPDLSEGQREIKRFHVALDRAVARWNELPPTTLETLAFHAAFTSSPGVGVAWRDVELDDSGEPTDEVSNPAKGLALASPGGGACESGVCDQPPCGTTDPKRISPKMASN